MAISTAPRKLEKVSGYDVVVEVVSDAIVVEVVSDAISGITASFPRYDAGVYGYLVKYLYVHKLVVRRSVLAGSFSDVAVDRRLLLFGGTAQSLTVFIEGGGVTCPRA